MSRSCIETVWQLNFNSYLYFYSCSKYFFCWMHPKHFSPFLSLHPNHFSPFLSLCLWFSLSHSVSVSLSFSFSLFLTYIVVLFYTMPIEIVNRLGLTFMIYRNINFHGFLPFSLFNHNCRHFTAVYECIPSVIGSCLARELASAY